jgi:invasion protein IalB
VLVFQAVSLQKPTVIASESEAISAQDSQGPGLSSGVAHGGWRLACLSEPEFFADVCFLGALKKATPFVEFKN